MRAISIDSGSQDKPEPFILSVILWVLGSQLCISRLGKIQKITVLETESSQLGRGNSQKNRNQRQKVKLGY